jgi:hypothetical protein
MEGYIEGDHIELINKFTVSYRGDNYHIFFKGRIYNLLSLSITFVDDEKQDIRKTIFELFERYDFNFKSLNVALNGDYALVIIKEETSENRTQSPSSPFASQTGTGNITDIWMSTDHIGNVKLYYLTQSPSAPFASQTGAGYLTGKIPQIIRFSLKPFEDAFIMPGGFMTHLRLDNEGNIKEEIFMEYEEEYNPAIRAGNPVLGAGNPVLGAGNSSDMIRDLSNAYVLIGFALDCIIEKRLKHTKKVYKGESREDKYIMKVARVFNEDIEEVEEKGKKVISGNYEGEEGIYPFHDKTFLRLISRVEESIREELYKRLFI